MLVKHIHWCNITAHRRTVHLAQSSDLPFKYLIKGLIKSWISAGITMEYAQGFKITIFLKKLLLEVFKKLSIESLSAMVKAVINLRQCKRIRLGTKAT